MEFPPWCNIFLSKVTTVSTFCVTVSACRSVCLSISLFLIVSFFSPTIDLLINLSLPLSYLHLSFPASVSICLSFCLSVSDFLSLSIPLSVCIYTLIFLCLIILHNSPLHGPDPIPVFCVTIWTLFFLLPYIPVFCVTIWSLFFLLPYIPVFCVTLWSLFFLLPYIFGVCLTLWSLFFLLP